MDGELNEKINNPDMSPEENSIGPVIGSIIVIVIIIVGGLYFWGKTIDEKNNSMPAEEIMSAEDQKTLDLQKQSSSDDITAIEKDLNESNLNDLDKEIEDIEKELGL